MKYIRQLKSSIYAYTTSVEETHIRTGLLNIKRSDQVWAGYSDELTEGIYLSPSGLNINSTSLFWKWGQPNGENLENCAVFGGQDNLEIVDHPCASQKYITCEINNQLDFNIPNINDIFNQYDDMKLVMELNDKSKFVFYSFDGSSIENHQGNTWRLISKDGYVLMQRDENGFPLGHKSWTKCDGQKVDVVFDACNKSEFGCSDGSCISMYKRCNEQIDCSGKNPFALQLFKI